MENKNWVWGVVILAIAAGFFAGWLYGKQAGVTETGKKVKDLQSSLDVFVPPLPNTINLVSGKITAIKGDSFTMEIPSFTDRYPKPGQALAVESKTIRTTKNTDISETNFDPKTFKNGSPQKRAIQVGDLKIGNIVSVTVKENARTEQNLTAVSINRSSGI